MKKWKKLLISIVLFIFWMVLVFTPPTIITILEWDILDKQKLLVIWVIYAIVMFTVGFWMHMYEKEIFALTKRFKEFLKNGFKKKKGKANETQAQE